MNTFIFIFSVIIIFICNYGYIYSIFSLKKENEKLINYFNKLNNLIREYDKENERIDK